MSSWIDVVGSFIIGGIVILIMANLNLFISTTSQDNLYANITQRNLAGTSEVLEHDFYKMGFKVSGGRITQADSNSITFNADLENTGTEDKIEYYLGNVSELSNTKNPNDRILYRKINTSSAKVAGVVTKFDLTFFDSTGSQINYGALNSQTQRDKIRLLTIYLQVQSAEPVDGSYQAAEWKRKIFPKNFN